VCQQLVSAKVRTKNICKTEGKLPTLFRFYILLRYREPWSGNEDAQEGVDAEKFPLVHFHFVLCVEDGLGERKCVLKVSNAEKVLQVLVPLGAGWQRRPT
jgi:hypothetical protein